MDNQEKRQVLKMQVGQANALARRRGLPATVTEGQFVAALRYWNWQCAVCQASPNTLHLDHWTPLSEYGCPGSVIENLVPLCPGCTASKKGRNGDAWLARKLMGRALVEAQGRLTRYRATVATLPTDDMTIPDSYSPEPAPSGARKEVAAQILVRLYVDDSEQCRLWDHYQALAQRNKGTEWIVETLIKALPPDVTASSELSDE